jgi:hypothetical protein
MISKINMNTANLNSRQIGFGEKVDKRIDNVEERLVNLEKGLKLQEEKTKLQSFFNGAIIGSLESYNPRNSYSYYVDLQEPIKIMQELNKLA